MTQQLLGQCEKLMHQIEEGCARVRRLREVQAEIQETFGLFSLFGEDGELERIIERNEARVAEYAKLASRLDEWIGTIKDPVIRRALGLRYLDGLTWPQVAARMGYSGESGARMVVSRFIEKLPEK